MENLVIKESGTRTLESLEAAIDASIGVLQAAAKYDGVETLKHVLKVSLTEVK